MIYFNTELIHFWLSNDDIHDCAQQLIDRFRKMLMEPTYSVMCIKCKLLADQYFSYRTGMCWQGWQSEIYKDP